MLPYYIKESDNNCIYVNNLCILALWLLERGNMEQFFTVCEAIRRAVHLDNSQGMIHELYRMATECRKE